MASNFNYSDIPMQETIPQGSEGSQPRWPDPNATSALRAIADRSAFQVQSMMGPGEVGRQPGLPGGETGAKPLPGQPTVSGWQGGQYFHAQVPGQSGSSTGGTGGSRPGSSRSGGGGASGSSFQATGPIIPEPTYNAPKAPTMPDYTAREYSPPEEDKGYERAKRRELMGAGSRELRQRTQEAIVGARSLSNPAARKDFVRSALAGYGEGLEKVSRGATGSAAGLARQKRAEDLNLYQSKYKVLQGADLTNYENEINRITNDYTNANWGAQQAYATQRAAYMNQPQSNIAAGATAVPQTALEKARAAAGLSPSGNSITQAYRAKQASFPTVSYR